MAVELSSIYRLIADGKGQDYELLFSIQGMFLSVMEFDPVTDEPLHVTVDDVLYGLASFDVQNHDWQNDRLQHIIDFVSSAIRNLINILHEKNLREYHISRPESVHEIDSRCMMWLAKKPGFTVKQKIAAEQRMMGVYHTTSLDTSENRLFKAFMQKLDILLTEKENACRKCGLLLSDDAEHFISVVHDWLKSDESYQIGAWNNTSPNNTLLNDKNYRKIWKAHLMLQSLNELIQNDLTHFNKVKNSAFFWFTVSRLNLSKDIRFGQSVLSPNYKEFSIASDGFKLIGFANNNSWENFRVFLQDDSLVLSLGKDSAEYSLPSDIETIEDIYSCAEQVCANFFPKKSFVIDCVEKNSFIKNQIPIRSIAAVDLNSILPTFTLEDNTKGLFSKKLLYQQIGKDACSSSRSKLIFTGSKKDQLKTVSIHSIFDSDLLADSDSDENKSSVEKACSDFVKTIKDELHCTKCLYVTSDDVDDFSPSVNAFKHCINSVFSQTEILPRSIAALFTKLTDIQNRFHKNDEILVRAIYDDYEIDTKIRIGFDENLANLNPKTKGFIFQRLGFKRKNIKSHFSQNIVPQILNRIITMQDASLLRNSFSVNEFHFVSKVPMSSVQGQKNEIIIYSNDDTSTGAVEYNRLQSITPDISLWYDFLPRLSMFDATGKEYVLVESDKVSVRPLVGKPVHIPIDWKFSFPIRKMFYEFPLMQGDKKEESKYFAFIKDSSFPLERETLCKLYLTYTYGMPLPYNLEFKSISDKAEFKSVTVKWENKSHKDYIHDMPVPNFVREYTWNDMRAVSGGKSDRWGASNLIEEWLPMEFEKIKKLANGNYKIYQIQGVFDGSKDVNNMRDYEVQIQLSNGRIINRKLKSKRKISINDELICEVKDEINYNGYIYEKIKTQKLVSDFLTSIRFPALIVWNNGKSIEDNNCPKSFKDSVCAINESVKKCFGNHVPESIQREIMFLLSCMHKDTPEWFARFLVDSVIECKSEFWYWDYNNWIAYAIGDCSKDWQKDLLQKIFLLLSDNTRVIYAIKILAKAFWREKKFVYNLNESSIEKLIYVINSNINLKPKDAQAQRVLTSACLECIVALCRLREKQDKTTADEKMLSILSPKTNQDVKEIIYKLEIIKKSEKNIKTFLTFDIDRPADDNTPELLYAAYGYLSGSIDNNSIRVLEADFVNE